LHRHALSGWLFWDNRGMRVGLFVTCLVDLMRPRIGFAALRLLEAAGCEVFVPQTQTCCGQPGYNSGDRASAQALARKLLAEFEACDYVVAPSGSCAGMIRTHYPDLFADAPVELERAQRLCARTFELTDFLVNVAGYECGKKISIKSITYHDSCAGLRELGVKSQPRTLLAGTQGAQLREMPEAEACCGFGGTFAVKFGEISTRLADNKCSAIAATGAEAVVLGDLGCMLHIEGRLRRRGDTTTRVLHIAELLTDTQAQ
jgi:L-lactate dehydrogenase complex protein LldE